MTEHFSDDPETDLSKLVTKKGCSDKNDSILSYDHMYTPIAENGEITNSNCQGAESEVKFLKDWLILHLDLIQQQSDDILSKERTILILQQENAMLKERLSCMERGAPFQPANFYCFEGAMTQDPAPCDEDKTCLELIKLKCENNGAKIRDAIETKFEPQSEVSETDAMKNVKMSIRRKSNCSAVSNSADENRSFRKFKKRRKKTLKDSQILTTSEHYITETNKTNSPALDAALDIPNNTNLEVPRWRIKVYASCYAMEGTENLDDEVFNKRHCRLENDERRRKRWDVQRIREQRMVEKLKQRQERVGSCSRSEEQNEATHSLWPTPEDIKFIEVSEQLPVSAFGCPMPKIPSSEFALPWLANPSLLTAKKASKRSKRKSVKR